MTLTHACSRALIAFAASAAVVGASLTSPAVAADCSALAADAADASARAAACAVEVEAESERTPWKSVFAMPDGASRLELSATAVRARMGDSWVPVDSTFRLDAGGVTVAAPVADMVFSDGTVGKPLAVIEYEGHRLEYDAPFDLPAPELDGSTLVYADVIPGVDLLLRVDEDASGFSEVLRVDDERAAADPRLEQLRFAVSTSSGLDVIESEGALAAVDDEGAPVFAGAVPTMWDSSGAPGLGSSDAGVDAAAGPADGATVVAMPLDVAEGSAVVTPDSDMLRDTGTVWPVYIDPSVGANLNRWAGVRTAYDTRANFDGDFGVGFCDDSLDPACGMDYRSRIIWQFNGLGEVPYLDGSDVISAEFTAFGSWSYSCTATKVDAYRLPTLPAEPTWASWPSTAQYLSGVTAADRPGCADADDQPGRNVWGVKAAAQWAADNDATSLTIGLKASSESSMSSWHKYRGDATLSVTYDRAPIVRWSKIDGNDCGMVTRDQTVLLSARIDDLDARDEVKAWFRVYAASGTRKWTSGDWISSSAVPATLSARTTALAEGDYVFEVTARDSHDLRHVTECAFTIDRSPPSPPRVTPVEGQPGVYREDQWGGGIGLTGKFKVDPATQDVGKDVVSFRYVFDGSSPSTSVPSSGTITWTPGAEDAGSHTLRALAVDRAGNVSEPYTYRFNVQMSARQAQWRMNGPSASAMTEILRDSKNPDNPLELAGGPTVVDGPLRPDFNPSDFALDFTGAPSVRASTTSSVVALMKTYTVMAYLKPSAVGTYTAVSQSGSRVNGFSLGTYKDSGSCSSGCWSFAVYPDDVDGADPVRVVTTAVPVTVGAWTMVAGSYNASTSTVSVRVCALGEAVQSPVSANFEADWESHGPLHIGLGKVNGATTQYWRGSVDEVTVYTSISSAELTRRCTAFDQEV